MVLSGCSAVTTVDEFRPTNQAIQLNDSEKVVILGRRDAGHYETDSEFIDCVANRINSADIRVVAEQEFIDAIYPWFEPRTAPFSLDRLDKLMAMPRVADKLGQLDIKYMIWIDGRTQGTNSSGSMTCGVGPTGAGCFGFGTWGTESEYEATIWNFSDWAEVGKMSAQASGQSYMPAVVVPIPIIAPVQDTACESLGTQLSEYLSSGS